MRLKAVIFDIDGVLLNSIKSNAVFFERVFKHLGIRYSQKEYIDRNFWTMWNIIKYFTKEKSNSKIHKIWDFARKFPYPHNKVTIPKDAKIALKSLSKKYKLGVVTARQKLGVGPVLKRYGYDKFISTKVAFEDYKNPKPHPEPLLIALKKMKVKANEAIYVGDMESDVLCATAAGVKSVLYRNRYSNAKHTPDYEVRSFKQLLKIINAE
ncbi:MAG: hypothetical protein A3I07_00180 [Candidatus Doudnabacteria bacterium RIFCSPLOWO2_02_FULL_42_9]|nr:MAG: hypothetical protein A3K07_00075 [Candidatus Doudnabacteria bacterium RIFCSPHIGHO2_01_43_10]OGE86709.1 MAG: hypothetical protein A3C49_01505 [Candidatus Doudnabacteria bacterium RIFCSPHIGHO2_02_FULL_42_25]OGF00146.1 MAG: hypothetical protein A3I07_00180 [Candidatus Doudnabacteria bacterium RIFCSPLOWO2_02_FULL_42_9]